MGRADATRTAHQPRPPPVGLAHDPVRRRRRLVWPQCVAGRRHVRPLPGRSGLGQRELARVLRRLSAGAGSPPPEPGHHGRRGRSRCQWISHSGGDRSGHGRSGGARPPRRPPRLRPEEVGEEATVLRGAASRIVANMEASLGVPTATSVRSVPARLLEVNRLILNNQLARTTGAKVSFTHIIGYAVVRALHDVPALNAAFVPDADGSGKPGIIHHKHVGLGLAVDQEKKRRDAHAARALHQGGRHPRLPCVRPGLRGPDPQDPHRQDRTGRLRRNHGLADQPGHARHGAVRAAAHAGPGRHRRRRCVGVPGRLRGGRPPGAGPARFGQGGHAHVDLRPPHHPGSRVRPLPGPGRGPPHGRRRLLRRPLRVDGRPLRAGALAG